MIKKISYKTIPAPSGHNFRHFAWVIERNGKIRQTIYTQMNHKMAKGKTFFIVRCLKHIPVFMNIQY